MPSKPLVTVGMTVRNSERAITLAIASIVAQTCEDWELIVLDDGSDDDTVRIARSFGDSRIRVVSDRQRKGIPARRNEILSLSRGTYLAWMDSDDVAYPERLAVEVDFLETHPQIDLVAAEMIVFRGDGEVVGKRSLPSRHEDLCRRPYVGFAMGQPTFMARLSWFQKFGYDERMKRAQDQDQLLRAFRTSRYAGIQQILVGYRESRIDLRKIFLGRRLWIGSIWRDAKVHSSSIRGIAAALVQLAKIAVEVVAVSSGLNYAILGHRAAPVSDSDRQKFLDVLAAVRGVADADREKQAAGGNR